MRRKKLFIGLCLVAAICVAASSSYFFYLRQSDSSYDALTAEIAKASKAEEAISAGMTQTSSVYINENYLKLYSQYSEDFSHAVDAITESPVVEKDARVGDMYSAKRGVFEAYIASNKNLISSMKLYLSVASACQSASYSLDVMRSKKALVDDNTFNAKVADCKNAITTSRTAPDKKFNDQFLTDYAAKMTGLIGAYRQSFGKTDGSDVVDIEKIWSEVFAMNSEGIDLTRSPDPASSLAELSRTVGDQKKKIFR